MASSTRPARAGVRAPHTTLSPGRGAGREGLLSSDAAERLRISTLGIVSDGESTRTGLGQAALHAFLAFRNADMDLWRRASAQLGLSIQATRVLARIIRSAEAGAPLRQVDLTRAMQMSPAGLSQIIDQLEERRLVHRVRLEADRRAYGLEPGEGSAPIGRVFAEYFAEFHRLSEDMTAEQLTAVIDLMRGMEAASAGPFTESATPRSGEGAIGST